MSNTNCQELSDIIFHCRHLSKLGILVNAASTLSVFYSSKISLNKCLVDLLIIYLLGLFVLPPDHYGVIIMTSETLLGTAHTTLLVGCWQVQITFGGEIGGIRSVLHVAHMTVYVHFLVGLNSHQMVSYNMTTWVLTAVGKLLFPYFTTASLMLNVKGRKSGDLMNSETHKRLSLIEI